MPRLVVVLPLEPLGVGEGWHLNDWPLHVTVSGTFVIDRDASEIAETIAPLLAASPPIEALVGENAGFGRAGDIPVSLIDADTSLTQLHSKLVDALEAAGAVFDDPEYQREGYRPHATWTKHARLEPGIPLRLEQATLVDMAPQGDGKLRCVVWAAGLGG